MMTKTIEQEALDLINEVRRERGRPKEERLSCPSVSTHEAIYRAVKDLRAERVSHAATKAEHEAFRQEVSDGLHHYFGPKLNDVAHGYLGRFIITKPDPVVEAIRDMALTDATQEDADRLRAALAARGIKLVEAGDAD